MRTVPQGMPSLAHSVPLLAECLCPKKLRPKNVANGKTLSGQQLLFTFVRNSILVACPLTMDYELKANSMKCSTDEVLGYVIRPQLTTLT